MPDILCTFHKGARLCTGPLCCAVTLSGWGLHSRVYCLTGLQGGSQEEGLAICISQVLSGLQIPLVVCSLALPLCARLSVFWKDTNHVRSLPCLVASFNLNSFLEACLYTWSPGTWGFNICTSLTAMMSFLLVYLWGGLGMAFCHH